MTVAWSAALIAQSALAMCLPPGRLRQYHGWQVLGQVPLFAIHEHWRAAYLLAWLTFFAVDSAMLIRACGRMRWPLVSLSALALLIGVCVGSAWYFDRPALTWRALRIAAPWPAMAWAMGSARGWLLGYTALRLLFAVTLWWAWFSSGAVQEARQWAQGALFAAWTISVSLRK